MALDGDQITMDGTKYASTSFTSGGESGRVLLGGHGEVVIQIAGQPEIRLPEHAARELTKALNSHHLDDS